MTKPAAEEKNEIRHFIRIVPKEGDAPDYPADVALAIREGLALARKRDYVPLVVCVSPGPRAVFESIVGIGERGEDLGGEPMKGLKCAVLDPDYAGEDFRIYDHDLRLGEAVMVRIVADSWREYGEETLRMIRTPDGAFLAAPRLRINPQGGKFFWGGRLGDLAKMPEGTA